MVQNSKQKRFCEICGGEVAYGMRYPHRMIKATGYDILCRNCYVPPSGSKETGVMDVLGWFAGGIVLVALLFVLIGFLLILGSV